MVSLFWPRLFPELELMPPEDSWAQGLARNSAQAIQSGVSGPGMRDGFRDRGLRKAQEGGLGHQGPSLHCCTLNMGLVRPDGCCVTEPLPHPRRALLQRKIAAHAGGQQFS